MWLGIKIVWMIKTILFCRRHYQHTVLWLSPHLRSFHRIWCWQMTSCPLPTLIRHWVPLQYIWWVFKYCWNLMAE